MSERVCLPIEMAHCEATLLREIADPAMKRIDVAQTYWFSLRSSEEVDWAKVNQAIIARWSFNALTKIKEAAWKPELPNKV